MIMVRTLLYIWDAHYYYVQLVFILWCIIAVLACLRRYRRGNRAYRYYSIGLCWILVILLGITVAGRPPNPHAHIIHYIIRSSIVLALIICAIRYLYVGLRVEHRKDER